MATSDNPIAIDAAAAAQAPALVWGPDALQASREARRRRQGELAADRDRWVRSNRYFYDRLKRLLRFIVEPGKRVLEIRCQTGHLLAAVEPSHGVGVEISERLVEKAQQNYPQLEFITSDPEDLELNEAFDYVMVSHLFDTVDILAALRQARKMCRRETRLIVCNYNPLWQPLLELASKLGLRAPFEEPSWMSERDVTGFLDLAEFSVVRTYRLLLLPKYIPVLSWFCNDVLARLPGIRRLCLMQLIVARPKPQPQKESDVSVSVIIPCRNERTMSQQAVERIPEMGKHTEIIFCDDQSTDGTGAEEERIMALIPRSRHPADRGPGNLQSRECVDWLSRGTGDVLMILDGDLAVMPEELPVFCARCYRQAAIYQWQPAGLSHSSAGHEVRQHDRQQVVWLRCFRSCWISALKTRCAGRKYCGGETGSASSATWGSGE